jgi:hypothetical protein
MENLLMSKNGMYIVTPDNVYSIAEDKTYFINEITVDKWLDIFKENSIFSIKNKLIGITEMASYHRKVSYQIIENYDFDKKCKLMLEYEGKFGNTLLLENSVLLEGWLGDAWDWTKKTASEAGTFLVDRVKGYGTGAIKLAKDLAVCVTGNGCNPFFEDFREILFSPEGMAIEAVLTATGIGGLGVMGMWAVLLGYDIYSKIKGDPNSSWVNIVIDAIGVASAGGLTLLGKALRQSGMVAKTAGKGIEEAIGVAAKNPQTAGIMKKAGTMIAEKMPTITKAMKDASAWASKKLRINWLTGLADKFAAFMAKILDAIGIKAGKEQLGKSLLNPATGKNFTSAAKVQAANQAILKKGVKSGMTSGAMAVGIGKAAETETGKNVLNKVSGWFGGNPYDDLMKAGNKIGVDYSKTKL